MAAHVLSGEQPDNIPIVHSSDLQFQVDWRAAPAYPGIGTSARQRALIPGPHSLGAGPQILPCSLL
jgi:hypothetical protein